MDQNSAPAQPSALNQVIVLYQQGKLQEALAAAKRGLAVRPGDGELLNAAGAAARGLGFPQAAQRYYRKAIAAQPGLADAFYNLGNLLKAHNRQSEAEAAYRRALDLNPRYVGAHNNLGALLQERGQFDEAEAAYRQALAIRPDHIPAHNNLANTLKECGRLAEAEAILLRALDLCPDDYETRWNLGLLLLSLGRYAEGWPAFEARWDPAARQPVARLPAFPFPRWRGEALAGKSLLLVPEQGLGDQIQFCRYVPLLKRRGAARVDILCDGIMVALFETLDGVDAIVSTATGAQALDGYGCWTLPMSIPLHVKTTLDTIPADLPYLHARPERVERWRERLPREGLRVGLVWRGNDQNPRDTHRSLPSLRTLAPLWAVPGITFVSLQKGAGEEEALAPPDGQPLVHLGPAIEDFADTAAIVSQLDLVIGVDTAVAHLAGALGKPCWVLLPGIGTDWRWLLERVDSPWYPGVMRLFRQTAPGDWAAVVAQVAHCLRGYAMRR